MFSNERRSVVIGLLDLLLARRVVLLHLLLLFLVRFLLRLLVFLLRLLLLLEALIVQLLVLLLFRWRIGDVWDRRSTFARRQAAPQHRNPATTIATLWRDSFANPLSDLKSAQYIPNHPRADSRKKFYRQYPRPRTFVHALAVLARVAVLFQVPDMAVTCPLTDYGLFALRVPCPAIAGRVAPATTAASAPPSTHLLLLPARENLPSSSSIAPLRNYPAETPPAVQCLARSLPLPCVTDRSFESLPRSDPTKRCMCIWLSYTRSPTALANPR
jgi:hypothetical protein